MNKNIASQKFPDLTEREFLLLTLSHKIRALEGEIEFFSNYNRPDVVEKFKKQLELVKEEYKRA